MQNHLNRKVLITCSGWFYAPDGKQYKAVHGTLKAIHEAGKTLGFIPNRAHANWFVEVGDMIIMGCQVMYIVQSETVNEGPAKDWNSETGTVQEYERPSAIYVTD